MALHQDGLDILSEGECRRLLEQTRVGRVVIATGGIAVVFPVNYGVIGGDILFFTGEGTKLAAAERSTTVTFEADAVDFDRSDCCRAWAAWNGRSSGSPPSTPRTWSPRWPRCTSGTSPGRLWLQNVG